MTAVDTNLVVRLLTQDDRKQAAIASAGGWGFGHFTDGKPADAAFMQPCFPCHAKAKDTDYVFTHYAQ
jgi:hypothetical protein